MPEFEFLQPATVDDAVQLLARHGRDAWVLAGGLDSLDWFKDRVKRPRVVVDLSGIPELKGVRPMPDGGLEIGAMTTLTEVATHPDIRSAIGSWRKPPAGSPRRRSAIRAPSAATCPRIPAATITGAVSTATGPAATRATPIRRRRKTASTASSAPTAAWR